MKDLVREYEYCAKVTGYPEKANPQEAFFANSVLTSSAYDVRSFSSPASSGYSAEAQILPVQTPDFLSRCPDRNSVLQWL